MNVGASVVNVPSILAVEIYQSMIINWIYSISAGGGDEENGNILILNVVVVVAGNRNRFPKPRINPLLLTIIISLIRGTSEVGDFMTTTSQMRRRLPW